MYSYEARITYLRNHLRSEQEEHAKEIQRYTQKLKHEVYCRNELLKSEREKRKDLIDRQNKQIDNKNSEILNLKQSNKRLQQECNELRKKFKVKDEEMRYNAERMKKIESSYLRDQTLREKHLQTLLSEERAKRKTFQKQYLEIMEEQKESLSRLSKEQLHSNHLEKERDYYKNSLQQLLEDFETCIATKDAQLEQTKSLLSTKDDELRKLRGELKDKTERLASTFQRRLKHDQRRIENTAEFNTPSEVENQFKHFLDGERLDACDLIQSTLSPTEEIGMQIRYLACIIFVTAYEQMEEAREAAYDLFNNIIRQLIDEAPGKCQELCIRRKDDGFSSQLSVKFDVSAESNDVKDNKDIIDGLMLSLKQTAHFCKLECFEEDVKRMVLGRWTKCLRAKQEMPLLPPLSEEVINKLHDYIKACIRMAWKMVTQVPPLQLEYNSTKFNKKMHELTRLHNNNDSTEHCHSENIACYLWPALVEHGGRVIFPGEVLCK